MNPEVEKSPKVVWWPDLTFGPINLWNCPYYKRKGEKIDRNPVEFHRLSHLQADVRKKVE